MRLSVQQLRSAPHGVSVQAISHPLFASIGAPICSVASQVLICFVICRIMKLHYEILKFEIETGLD
ncbi:hypothetical protein SESBI_06466 [Sesbania bispinosa]|nr:hypothetical protein SESBI_06466 [Sesbania bispinosa]